MKNLALVAALFAASIQNTGANQFDSVLQATMVLQPANTPSEAFIIAQAVSKTAEKYKLDWMVVLSILTQESSLRRDPQGCARPRAKCADYGIAQINWRTWGGTLKLDRARLTSDIPYTVDIMGRILSDYRAKYAHSGPTWWGRYHNRKPALLQGYVQKVEVHHGKIKVALRGKPDGKSRKQNPRSHTRPPTLLYAGRDSDALFVLLRPR